MEQKKYLLFEEISCEYFINAISKDVLKVLDARQAKLQPPVIDDPFITRQDVANLYHITLPTVHSWMNQGILKPYKIGNKTRFLLSEVKAAALSQNKKEVNNA